MRHVHAAPGEAADLRASVEARLRAAGLRNSRSRQQVVDVLPLGGRRQLTVVRCYDRTFALGLGEKDVSLIAEIDPIFAPEETEETAADPAERDFLALFDRAKRRIAKQQAEEKLEPTSVQELVG